MNAHCFVSTLIEYLPEHLRTEWTQMEARDRALRVRALLVRAAESGSAWAAFSAQRALEWIENAQSVCPEPHATYTAARMTAQAVVAMEIG
jgi:hypothetical protein